MIPVKSITTMKRPAVRDTLGRDLMGSVVKSKVDSYGESGYTTYGIEITRFDGARCLLIKDISTDRSFVENFVRICEAQQVCLLHVRDVLEDMLLMK